MDQDVEIDTKSTNTASTDAESMLKQAVQSLLQTHTRGEVLNKVFGEVYKEDTKYMDEGSLYYWNKIVSNNVCNLLKIADEETEKLKVVTSVKLYAKPKSLAFLNDRYLIGFCCLKKGYLFHLYDIFFGKERPVDFECDFSLPPKISDSVLKVIDATYLILIMTVGFSFSTILIKLEVGKFICKALAKVDHNGRAFGKIIVDSTCPRKFILVTSDVNGHNRFLKFGRIENEQLIFEEETIAFPRGVPLLRLTGKQLQAVIQNHELEDLDSTGNFYFEYYDLTRIELPYTKLCNLKVSGGFSTQLTSTFTHFSFSTGTYLVGHSEINTLNRAIPLYLLDLNENKLELIKTLPKGIVESYVNEDEILSVWRYGSGNELLVYRYPLKKPERLCNLALFKVKRHPNKSILSSLPSNMHSFPSSAEINFMKHSVDEHQDASTSSSYEAKRRKMEF